jgi:putative hydrolase of the HAD superfamily
MERRVEGWPSMNYQAVIFDLFGTLIDKFPLREHQEALKQMAATVSAPADDFIKLWFDTFNERDLGVFQRIEENVAYICQRLDIHSDDGNIKAAARINLDYAAKNMKARPDAVETLSMLRERGYKTGLITNCGAAIPPILEKMPLSSWLDVSVFSPFVGIHKPDPRIYMVAVERLAVKPEDCLYIGDGDCKELTGAANIGMNPILIRDPDEDRANVHRVDYEADDWKGPAISSLKEIWALLGEGNKE